MTDDKIKTLLQQADQMAPPPDLPADLAGLVRRKAHRRKRSTRAVSIAAAAALAILALGIFRSLPQKLASPLPSRQTVTGRSRDSQPQVAQLSTEVDRLRDEINARMAMIEEMLARVQRQQKLADLERRLAALPDPVEQVNRQIEKAAFITLYQANRKYNELNLKESALADYHQVIKLFPNTQSAYEAEKILGQIKTNQKGELL